MTFSSKKQSQSKVLTGFQRRIVAANNHYGGYGPGTVDIFRENMDMEKLSFDDIIDKIITY